MNPRPLVLPALALGGLLSLVGCGTGPGDTQICRQTPASCDGALLNAFHVFSEDGCESAIDNVYCGVHAQKLAECLHAAQVCLELPQTREAIKAALAVSVCAAQFEQWDGCFANGEGGGGGGDDDDD